MMTAAALKKHWLGRSVFPVKSLGVFCEDDPDELHKRQADINRLYECEFSDLGNMRAVPRLGKDNFLMVFARNDGQNSRHFGVRSLKRRATSGLNFYPSTPSQTLTGEIITTPGRSALSCKWG